MPSGIAMKSKSRHGWVVMYTRKDDVSDDWRNTHVYRRYDHEPTGVEMQFVRDKLGPEYDVDWMHYEVGEFPSLVRFLPPLTEH